MKKVCFLALALLFTLAVAVPCLAIAADSEPAQSTVPMPEEVETAPPEPSAESEKPAPEDLPAPDVPPAPDVSPTPDVPSGLEIPPQPDAPSAADVPSTPDAPPAEDALSTPDAPAEDLAAETVPAQEEVPLPDDDPVLIRVTVPATGEISINPYGLPVETVSGVSTEQIVSDALIITNESTVPVVVSASAAGRVSELSSMIYVSAPLPADAWEKWVFLYAEFQDEDGEWSGDYSGGDNQILISEAATEVKEVLTLDAGADGVFRLCGSAAVAPEDPWCSDDEISVVLTFTFTASDDLPKAEVTEPTENPVEKPTAEPVEESPDHSGAAQEADSAETPTESPPEASEVSSDDWLSDELA